MTKANLADGAFGLFERILVLCLAVGFAPLWLLHFGVARLEGHPWLHVRLIAFRDQTTLSVLEARPLQRWCRVLNLDLVRLSPRLLSVLLGRIRLVGPGLLSPEEASRLTPAQQARFVVRPGLVSRFFLQSSMNIAFTSEPDSALEDAQNHNPIKKLPMLFRGLIALVLRGSGDHVAPAQLNMFGITMVNETRDAAVARLLALADKPDFKQIAFVNPGCVNILLKDETYRQALEQCQVIFPDGIGIKIAGRYLNQPLRDNLNGTDLFPAICDQIQASHHGIFLLGAQPGVCETMCENLKARWPELHICGFRHGYINGPEDEAGVIEQINQSGANWLFVAMGVPGQELWLHRVGPQLQVRVALGVGGLFDFMSGRLRRAPLWLREIGMEWAYRLALEPRRLWRRYVIGNFVFLWNMVRYHA